jgi:hypothetical protein
VFADSSKQYHIADITYAAANSGKVKNKLIVTTNATNAAMALVEVPYEVCSSQVLHLYLS